jgi:aminopeptidase
MKDATPAAVAHASSVLVQGTLRVGKGENLVIVCDAESDAVAQAIGRAGEAAGARVTIARLDQLRSASTNHSGERPHKVLPDLLRRAMGVAQGSVYLASAPHQELSMREQFFHLVHAHSIRHVHMPQVAMAELAQGFALGYDRVALWGKGMGGLLTLARVIDVESAAGTRLRVTMTDGARWLPRLGEIEPGAPVKFPAGVIYGAPASIDGVFVANASVGEFFGERHGLLLTTPLRLTIEQGRVVRADAPLAPPLEKDVRAMLAFAPNSDRIGVVAIGVNMGIASPTGMIRIDENMPGLHLIVGDPKGRETGVGWSARTAFAACQAGARVTVDGSVVIDAGKIVSVV